MLEYNMFKKVLRKAIEVHLEWHWRVEHMAFKSVWADLGLSKTWTFKDFLAALKSQRYYHGRSNTENTIVIRIGNACYRLFDDPMALWIVWKNLGRRELPGEYYLGANERRYAGWK